MSTDGDTKQESFDGSPSVLTAINDNHKPNIRLMKTTTTQHAILVSLCSASRSITSNTLHDSRWEYLAYLVPFQNFLGYTEYTVREQL